MGSAVREKSFEFAIVIVRLSRELQRVEREFVISRQLLRAGTAIGALVREAEQAESRADFAHKLAIALKEASETEYWLDLLVAYDLLSEQRHADLQSQIRELLRLLTAIVRTTRLSSTIVD